MKVSQSQYQCIVQLPCVRRRCTVSQEQQHSFCAAGPKEKLDSTVISQPAIYVASLAALEKLRQDSGEVNMLSQHLRLLSHGSGLKVLALCGHQA